MMIITVKNQAKHLGIITMIYLFTNAFLISNYGLFWDDWCLTTPSSREAIMTGVGNSLLIPIYNQIFNFTSEPAHFFHLFTVLFEIITYIFFYKILSYFKFSKNTLFIATLFFAILPFNQSKISVACFSYTAGLFFFTLAVYFFILFYNKNNIFYRLLSLLLFFCSFFMLPSTLLLMLVTVFIILIFSTENDFIINTKTFIQVYAKSLKLIDFIILPFCFWIFRSIYLMPQGVYAKSGYREFKIISIITSPVNVISSFSKNILTLPFIVIIEFAPLITIFAIFIFQLFKKCNFNFENNDNNKKKYLYLGLVLFIVSILPYVLLGLEPSFDGFNSRHQILFRISAVFLLLYILNFINSNNKKIFFISLLISSFVFYTVNIQLQFQKSWFKQIAIEKYFSKLNLNGISKKLCIIDNTKQYNEFKQYYEPYVYSGILNKIYKSDNLIAVDIENRPFKFDENDLITKKSYHIESLKNFENYDSVILIKTGKTLLSKAQLFKGTIYYYFNKNKFNNFVEQIIEFEQLDFRIKNQ
jgi:hypothetical protein